MAKRIPVCSVLLLALLFHVGSSMGQTPTILQQFFVLKSFDPDVKTIGVLLSNEPNPQFKQKLAQASVAVGVRSVISRVSGLHEIARAYRELVDYYKIDFLWIPPDDPVVATDLARDYLVRKTIEDGVGICAPTRDWVSKGATLWVGGERGKVRPYYNQRTLQALGLGVPEKYAQVSTAASE